MEAARKAMVADFKNWCIQHGYSRSLQLYSGPIAEFTLERMGYEPPEADVVSVKIDREEVTR